jgi:hypothetical protein
MKISWCSFVKRAGLGFGGLNAAILGAELICSDRLLILEVYTRGLPEMPRQKM